MSKSAFLIAGLILFISLVVWAIRHTQAAQKRSRYTIGYVTGWAQTAKNGRDIKYRTTIRGTVYTSAEHEKPGMNSTPGTRYVVAFDSLDASSNWAYYHEPVPDSVALPPPNGWTPHQFASLSSSWHRADSLQRAGLVNQQNSE